MFFEFKKNCEKNWFLTPMLQCYWHFPKMANLDEYRWLIFRFSFLKYNFQWHIFTTKYSIEQSFEHGTVLFGKKSYDINKPHS